MLRKAVDSWQRLSWRRRATAVLLALATVGCVAAALSYARNSDGLDFVESIPPRMAYLAVFALVVLDAVVPIFPGETTLNAAATAAAQGSIELLPVIVMGALGAIVGDSLLFWLARRFTHRLEPLVNRAKANDKVRQGFEIMDSRAPTLIVGGRYVPGMRFVVNATMGSSEMPYGRFLRWSVLSGALWSVYTCVLAYQIGRALGEFPLASVVISGLVTTIVLGAIVLKIRHQRRTAVAAG